MLASRRLSAALAAGCLLVAGAALAPTSPADETLAAKTPEEMLEASRVALAGVKSYRVDSVYSSKSSRFTVRFDVQLPGRIRATVKAGDVTADTLIVGSRAFIRANKAYWKGDKRTRSKASKLADRWIRSSVAGVGGEYLQRFAHPTTVGRCMIGRPQAYGTLAHAGTMPFAGQQAHVVNDSGDKPGTAPGTIYIAAAGPPLPLRAVQTGPAKRGGTPDKTCGESGDEPADSSARAEITFSRYNAPLSLTAPKHAIDPPQLPSSGGTPRSL